MGSVRHPWRPLADYLNRERGVIGVDAYLLELSISRQTLTGYVRKGLSEGQVQRVCSTLNVADPAEIWPDWTGPAKTDTSHDTLEVPEPDRSFRTEVDIAADTVAALAHARLLSTDDPQALCAAVGIRYVRAGRAVQRRQRGYYSPPRYKVPLTEAPDHKLSRQARQEKRRRTPSEPTHRTCTICRDRQPVTAFRVQDERGRRKSFCLECERDYQRGHYLSADEIENGHVLSMIADDALNLTSMFCEACGEPVHEGERIQTEAWFRHEECPSTGR